MHKSFHVMSEVWINGSKNDIKFMDSFTEFRSVFVRSEFDTHYTYIFQVPEEPGLLNFKMRENGCSESLMKAYSDAHFEGAKWIKIILIHWKEK